ncbi:MAG: hypothetical protein PHQ96_08515, partial [Candidatus Omnitrophica bacterium]|nr:hypothetical protein [Candidatus Omnitrophota bacterium]
MRYCVSILFVFSLFLAHQGVLCAASFDTSKTSLSSDLSSSTNSGSLSSQNSNSNTYSSSSTPQNYQQKTTSPSTNYNVYTKGAGANTNYVPAITDNYHPKRNQAASALSPQEGNVANAYPADFEEMSIPNQASGAKA